MKNIKDKLKIAFALTAIFAATAFYASGQEVTSENKRFEMGARLMPTISSFKMKTSDGNTVNGEAKLGWGGGAFAAFNFNEHVGVQGELLYFSVSQDNKEEAVTREVNLRYVNIPVLLSLNTGKSKPVNLNISAGPQLGVSAGSNVKTEGGDGITTPRAKAEVKTTDLGFAYGAGLDFGLNEARTVRLGVGFRGVYGLVDVSDNSATTNINSYFILEKSHVHTYSAYAGLSYMF